MTFFDGTGKYCPGQCFANCEVENYRNPLGMNKSGFEYPYVSVRRANIEPKMKSYIVDKIKKSGDGCHEVCDSLCPLHCTPGGSGCFADLYTNGCILSYSCQSLNHKGKKVYQLQVCQNFSDDIS